MEDQPALSLPDNEPDAATVPISVATAYYSQFCQPVASSTNRDEVLTLPHP